MQYIESKAHKSRLRKIRENNDFPFPEEKLEPTIRGCEGYLFGQWHVLSSSSDSLVNAHDKCIDSIQCGCCCCYFHRICQSVVPLCATSDMGAFKLCAKYLPVFFPLLNFHMISKKVDYMHCGVQWPPNAATESTTVQ